MALVPETGSGIPGANSYVSLAESDELLAEIGITTEWTDKGDPIREALLARASSVIDGEFAFRGELKSLEQGLAFPRVGLKDRNKRDILGIPRQLREATAELAFFLTTINVIEDETSVEGVQVGPINIKLGEKSTLKKLIPDSVLQKLSLFGSRTTSIRRSRRLSY